MGLACPRHGCGSWERFVPAASVGRREERSRRSCGDGRSRGHPDPVPITALLPCPCLASRLTAGLGDPHGEPQAASGPESDNNIASHSKIKQVLKGGTEEGLALEAQLCQHSETSAVSEAEELSKCTTMSCSCGLETPNVVQSNELKTRPEKPCRNGR